MTVSNKNLCSLFSSCTTPFLICLTCWHLHLEKIWIVLNRSKRVLFQFSYPPLRPPPPPWIPSEILHSLHHPNYYSFCNLTMLALCNVIKYHWTSYSKALSVPQWVVGLNEHNSTCSTDVTLIFVTRWSKLMLGTSQHPIQRLTRDVSLGMKPHVCEGDH